MNHSDRLQQQRDPGPLNRCPLVYHVTLLRVWARYCASRVPFALAEKTKVVGGERSAWATGSHRENARPTTKVGSSGGCETTSYGRRLGGAVVPTPRTRGGGWGTWRGPYLTVERVSTLGWVVVLVQRYRGPHRGNNWLRGFELLTTGLPITNHFACGRWPPSARQLPHPLLVKTQWSFRSPHRTVRNGE